MKKSHTPSFFTLKSGSWTRDSSFLPAAVLPGRRPSTPPYWSPICSRMCPDCQRRWFYVNVSMLSNSIISKVVWCHNVEAAIVAISSSRETFLKKPVASPEVPLSAHLCCRAEGKRSSLYFAIHILDGRDDAPSDREIAFNVVRPVETE